MHHTQGMDNEEETTGATFARELLDLSDALLHVYILS